MTHAVSFKCKGDESEELTESILKTVGVGFFEIHTCGKTMASVSQEKKKQDEDVICKVPYCVTVEAEAYGAEISIPDDKSGPKVEGYMFTKLEQLSELDDINLEQGRINEVLQSVKTLKENGNVVALNIEGPFTILGQLIDSVELFKGLNKHREIIDSALLVIENNIVNYALAGLEKGAQIISYADPSGTLGMLGPKLYKELSGKSTYNILKRIEGYLDGAVIHLCGITSQGLEKVDLCTSKAVLFPNGVTYGDAICNILDENKIKILGHNCMKNTPNVLANSVVWQIELV